jgi:small-conductance mechanosensitive channel
LQLTWANLIKYLPNLFNILIVCVLTYYFIRLSNALFKALENGSLVLPGFYRDWARPTYKLTAFLIWALAAAIIFPYLPGFNSPAFQGISLLVGAIITFGGASTISNIFGGFVTIYTRAFQLGDRITVAEFTGVVIEKSILSTRICTINNEIVTIPNSSIVASSIKNFSASLRDIQQPLILTTTVTLGYDLPWRLIHQTLIEAALATQEILADPPPTIWQKSLDDFYVSYELRCCTKFPSHFKEIYTELHANIQDKCNQAGIEIMSPSYTSLRDGNQTTIPTNYLDKAYRSAKFNVEITSPEEEKSI